MIFSSFFFYSNSIDSIAFLCSQIKDSILSLAPWVLQVFKFDSKSFKATLWPVILWNTLMCLSHAIAKYLLSLLNWISVAESINLIINENYY